MNEGPIAGRRLLGWLAIALALCVVATACSGSSAGSADQSAASAESAVAEPSPEAAAPTSAPTAEPTPEPTTAPTATPVPTPDPDTDGDGVLNDDDDFPDDAARSVALVSQFPLVDGVSQLPEDLPSVQALREIESLLLADEIDAARLEAAFDPGFLRSIPLADVAAILDGVRTSSAGEWEVVDVRAVTEWWLWVQLGHPARPLEPTVLLRIGVDPNTNLINEFAVNQWRQGLTAQQYPSERTKSLEAVVEDLASKTEFVGVLVADVTADGCTVIAGHNEDVPLSTASIYKEWVLGAAATEIAAGRLDPEQTVTFAPGQFMNIGALATAQFDSTFELSLQQAANLMIHLSDNGATDMVERTVGRQAAWDFVDSSGHSDPDILNPLLGIRDYNHLFGSVSAGQLEQFLAGSEEEQQAFVVEVLDPLGPNRTGAGLNPNVRSYSWAASPLDICETMATLRTRFSPDSVAGQFIDEAFSGEVALFGVRNEWERTWYKGGGVPGFAPETNVVLTHSTLVESNDGDTHVVVVMFNADEGFSNNPLQFEVASLQSRIFELLAQQ